MNLELWAQLNLIGHVSLQDYLLMDEEMAMACLQALNSTIEKAKHQRASESEEAERRRRQLSALDSLEAKHAGKSNRGI